MEERPFPCSLCKRKATVIYKEIKNGSVESCRMCSVCPILQAKLELPKRESEERITPLPADITCPNCQTRLQELQVEGRVGCPTCYEVFEECLPNELLKNDSIPLKPDSFAIQKKEIPIHLGGSPEIFRNEESLKKLESLHLALREALIFENYERAAHIRDQIKNLMGKSVGS